MALEPILPCLYLLPTCGAGRNIHITFPERGQQRHPWSCPGLTQVLVLRRCSLLGYMHGGSLIAVLNTLLSPPASSAARPHHDAEALSRAQFQGHGILYSGRKGKVPGMKQSQRAPGPLNWVPGRLVTVFLVPLLVSLLPIRPSSTHTAQASPKWHRVNSEK